MSAAYKVCWLFLFAGIRESWFNLVSFHHEPSPDPDGDICLPVDETAPHEESLSSDAADFDSICDTKPNEPSPVLCKQSLCEPCTIEKDGKGKSHQNCS